jgi:hypothetical protein
MDLTDDEIWMLLCAPASASSRDLAASHGLSVAQVMRVRLHYRRDGWTCPVDYVPCSVCGEPMTIARASAGSSPHHAQCRPALPIRDESMRAIQSNRQRYLPNVPRDPTVPGGRKFFKWTDEEDAVLIAHATSESLQAIGRMIDRSEASVRARQTRLRLDGLID